MRIISLHIIRAAAISDIRGNGNQSCIMPLISFEFVRFPIFKSKKISIREISRNKLDSSD